MSATIPIGDYFAATDWCAERLEDGFWRAAFATDELPDLEQFEEFVQGGFGSLVEVEHDLYVMADAEWVHFAVSPFTPRPTPACAGRLYEALLLLNQKMVLAHFGVDAEGDVNLLVDLPVAGFERTHFAATLTLLVEYTQTLALELSRLAVDPAYRSRISF